MKKMFYSTCVLGLLFSRNMLPIFGLSHSIESDMTIKNPEKFDQGKLIPHYLDKAEKTLKSINNDKAFTATNVSKHQGDKHLIEKIEKNLVILKNITDRFNSLSRRLKYESGQAYYNDMKTTYFKNLKGWKNTESDPYNILKLDDLDLNRDCLYRFLSWNIPGQKTPAEIRTMSYKDIQQAISNLRAKALEVTHSENSQYSMLVREIGAFFNDELEKEQYDAFIDGPQALDRLIIPTESKRKSLNNQLKNLFDLWVETRQKVLEAEQAVKQTH